MPELKFSNNFQKSITGTWPFEEEYKAILSKPAPKEDFIRIIGSSDGDMFYHFRLRTPTQQGFFHLECPIGFIDALWAFLEALCLGIDFASFLTEYEGPNALLCAKKIDKENLRITLICDTWLEVDYDKEMFVERCWPDFEPHASIDVVVNKRHFIYTLYMALEDIFINDNWDYSSHDLNVSSTEKAQVDSSIVKGYLGYTSATDKEIVLQKALFEGTAFDVEKCLKDGANPNALSPEGEGEFGQTLLEVFWHKAYGGSPSEEEKFNAVDYFKKNELMSNYGAMPRSTFFIFYTWASWGEELRTKVFRMFFEKHCFIRYDFWDFVAFDVRNEGADDWMIYVTMVKDGLWSEPQRWACFREIEYCKPWHQNLQKQCEALRGKDKI